MYSHENHYCFVNVWKIRRVEGEKGKRKNEFSEHGKSCNRVVNIIVLWLVSKHVSCSCVFRCAFSTFSINRRRKNKNKKALVKKSKFFLIAIFLFCTDFMLTLNCVSVVIMYICNYVHRSSIQKGFYLLFFSHIWKGKLEIYFLCSCLVAIECI